MKTTTALMCGLGFMLLLTGCGPSSPGTIAPMSGRLTLDGEPMPGVEIVFSPIANEQNGNPGPYSLGTTDADGRYTLKTRYGEEGAVVGRHNVTMEYADLEPDAMEILAQEYQELKIAGEEGNEEAMAEVLVRKERLEKKLKGRKMIPKSANGEYEVPGGGNENADFALTSEN